ncbi:HNH endonuclease [Virgibacillus kekensis]|uniref:HNH endonuclease n=1 Tax=Virgibacillus kekensis TaxID=202261 RepID=A0ABV9DHF4_9BACI
MSNERYIPLPLKRKVRKAAYFRCIICGNPIIEYHHIVPFHRVKEHSSDNLVALCPEHHHRADCGEIPLGSINKFRENPFNRDKNHISKDFFLSNYSALRTRVGSNVYIRTPKILIVDNQSLITITPDNDDNALLNAKFYDSKDMLVAEIKDNEWFAYQTPKLWDISYSPGHLKINRSKGDILMEFKLSDGNIDLRAEMYYHGYGISLLPDRTVLGQSSIISNSVMQDCGAGICISTGK